LFVGLSLPGVALAVGTGAVPATARELRGCVRAAAGGAPLVAAHVSARLRAAAPRHTVTGADGCFELALPAGAVTLEITAPGHAPARLVLEPGATGRVEAALARVLFSDRVDVSANAVAGAGDGPAVLPVRPVEVTGVAGGGENVFRALQTLPGVNAADDFGSRLAVRGGSPDQNLTVMDGVEIHNPYRLFGLTSAFNPETVGRFELTAGAFDARYGDRLSSLLVVDNRFGRDERAFGGSSSLSLTDANALFEGRLPVGVPGSWLVTARRTYYDLVAERFTDDDLPSFADVQAKLTRSTRARACGPRAGSTRRARATRS
jgi:hypothetical protein